VSIRLIEPERLEPRVLDELADVLADCVGGGATLMSRTLTATV
jgi:hypothetical protein